MPVNEEWPHPVADCPPYWPTAQAAAGATAVIAYSVRRLHRGPNGETNEAFLLSTQDAGAVWKELPLVRTIWSYVRFWGYPVWPPELIDSVAVTGELVRIVFRDEWVPFEPGGESLWKAVQSSNGLWLFERIRLMDYDGADIPRAPPPIGIQLPEGFHQPPPEMSEAVAARIAAEVSVSFDDRFWWLPGVLTGAAIVLTGPGWLLLAAAVLSVTSLPLLSILLERRRRRRAAAMATPPGRQ
jgi:hypothetical protein